MRLLNARTLQLTEFYGEDIPQYAILSHTWTSGQEVSFQEWMAPSMQVKQKSGYVKILGFAELAVNSGFDWVWVDTCCIDKSSSAELSEAINSMYQWYKESAICYVYLADVTDGPIAEVLFTKSKWFTRGWCLQELIAPAELVFFTKDWSLFGSRRLNASVTERVCSVPAAVLLGESPLTYSIAQRMSWAANRTTTRLEDIAYCLLGLMDVNMPMLYGEGTKAFIRLQREIIRNYSDRSLLAWEIPYSRYPETYVWNLLADSPQRFARCKNTDEISSIDSSFTLTNAGLDIRLSLSNDHEQDPSLFWADLRETTSGSCGDLWLRKVTEKSYVRVSPPEIRLDQGKLLRWDQGKLLRWDQGKLPPSEPINIVQNVSKVQLATLNGCRSLFVQMRPSIEQTVRILAVLSAGSSPPRDSKSVSSRTGNSYIQSGLQSATFEFPDPLPSRGAVWAALSLGPAPALGRRRPHNDHEDETNAINVLIEVGFISDEDVVENKSSGARHFRQPSEESASHWDPHGNAWQVWFRQTVCRRSKSLPRNLDPNEVLTVVNASSSFILPDDSAILLALDWNWRRFAFKLGCFYLSLDIRSRCTVRENRITLQLELDCVRADI